MPFAVPLRDPSESDGEEQRPGRWLRFWSVGSVALSATIYAWIYITGTQFEDLYRGFGGDLPWLTSTVFATYKVSGLLLLVGLIPCAMLLKDRSVSAKRKAHLVKLVVLGFGLAWTSLAVFILATYLPVLKIGATVQ